MSSQPWLRLDVDHSVALKNRKMGEELSIFRMITRFPIPFFLSHVAETQKLLLNYDIRQVWFFRELTCPDEFDKPFGVHITSPETAEKEIRTVRKKLGDFSLFTRHGFTRVASGRLWTADEIRFVEEEYGLKDVSDHPHITVSLWNENTIPSNIDNLLFHPCYIYTHRERLVNLLALILARAHARGP